MSNTTIDRRKKSDWEAKNPVLRFGEPGYDSSNNRLKIGDGRTPWNYLPWVEGAVDLGGGGGGTGDVSIAQLNAAVSLLQDKATAATDTELSAAIASVSGSISNKQDAATAATDSELANAISTINSALSSKQDASLAATDSEVASAVATLNSAIAGKADLSTEQADVAALQALITANTTAIGTMQPTATAATDAELAAHAADMTIHAGGKRTGYAVNEGGVSQVVSTAQTAIPSTSIPLPQIANPQVIRGRAHVKCTTAMSAVAGTVTSLQLVIVDDQGTLVDGGALIPFDAATTSAWATLFAEWDVPENAPARTYHLEILRTGSTSGVFTCLNGAIAPGFRTVIRALAC